MKKLAFVTVLLISCIGIFYWQYNELVILSNDLEIEEGERKPNDYFFKQRAFPFAQINHQAYLKALQQAKEMKTKQAQLKSADTTYWELVGPSNIGGRITDVEMHPEDLQSIYACAASGGIFKSIDQGDSWIPIFDEQASLSIGDMAVANTNADVLYVGTGEANAGGGSLAYDGVGVFKSTDAGVSWEHVGLDNIGSVGKVVIDPKDENKVLVAAMGDLFGNNSERGIYRTEDGGENWEQVLYLSDSTGCIDLAIHPTHPDTIYASMWERIRRPHYRQYGGETCGIYRSIDGGDNWTKISTGLNGFPTSDLGRMGLAIAASEPNIVYIVAADESGDFKGLYKSTDNGNNWVKKNDNELYNTYFYYSYGWWFGKIEVDPTDANKVYAMGLRMYRSTQGGDNWHEFSNALHLDQHSIYIHPLDPSLMVVGNDGGVYTSTTGGPSWVHKNTLPITQFYTCEVNQQNSNEIYGGAQDNGTSRTLTASIDNWAEVYGGDGMVVQVDPQNDSYVYVAYQYGNLARSSNGGSSFVGLSVPSGRSNWKTPYLLDPINPQTIYLGLERVHRSNNRGSSWTAISPDLTNGDPFTNLIYGTITSIAVSTLNNEIMYAGTDDGNVWNTLDGGENWTKISENLPERWVTSVHTHPSDSLSAYVTFSGYRYNEYLSHIFKTEDAGQTWMDISSNLPEAPANDLQIDPLQGNHLYLATDVGIFVSYTDGNEWTLMNDNLPNVPINDLCLHQEDRYLIAATYGRSMYRYQLGSIPTDTIPTDTSIVIVDTTVVDTTMLDTSIVVVDTMMLDTTTMDTSIVVVDTMMNDTMMTYITSISQANLQLKIYPIPVLERAFIDFNLDKAQKVRLSIVDISGRTVEVLHNAYLQEGKQHFIWDTDNIPQSGIYVLVLQTEEALYKTKMYVN